MAKPRENKRHRSGFVSILGLPNVGKSTLLNRLVGARVAIVSDKAQTTRTSVQGVLTRPGAQAVFIDTPGIHEGKFLLHKRMMDTVRESLEERDLLLWVADAAAGGRLMSDAGIDVKGLAALELVRGRKAPVFLVLNKVDALKRKEPLLAMIERYRTAAEFSEVFPVSALTGDGVAELTDAVLAALPEGPAYFPDDHLTDQPERFLASEFVREAVLELARQEVPHAVAVVVDKWEDTGSLVRIAATIFVERDGQKRILVGAGGGMLKRIGIGARREIESLLGRKVYLELFVKVRAEWRQSAQFLDEIDWRRMAGAE
jgi:GTP-binding protein Era